MEGHQIKAGTNTSLKLFYLSLSWCFFPFRYPLIKNCYSSSFSFINKSLIKGMNAFIHIYRVKSVVFFLYTGRSEVRVSDGSAALESEALSPSCCHNLTPSTLPPCDRLCGRLPYLHLCQTKQRAKGKKKMDYKPLLAVKVLQY